MVTKININVEIKDQDIDDIVCTALEGGINYWCNSAQIGEKTYYGKYASDQISRGGTLIIYVDEPFEEQETYTLTKAKLINGITQYLKDPVMSKDILTRGKEKGIFEIDCCQVDAVVADIIIQYALFGEEIYG